MGGVEFTYEPASNYQRVERVIDSQPIWLLLQTEGPFKPLGWVGRLSNRVVTGLLRRMENVAEQHGYGQTDLSVEENLNRIIQGTWGAAGLEDPQLAYVRRIVRDATLRHLLRAAEAEGPYPEVRRPVRDRLRSLLNDLQQGETDDPVERAHLDEAIQRIAGVGWEWARAR